MHAATVGLILLACAHCAMVNAGAGIGDRKNLLPQDGQNILEESPSEQTDLPISQEASTVSNPSDIEAGRNKCPQGFGSTGNTQTEDTETLFEGLTRCYKEIQEYDRVQAAWPPRLGMFHPACDANGDYMPVQCHGSVCYCVRPHDGLPLPYFGCYGIWEHENIKCPERATTVVVRTTTARPTQYYFSSTTKLSNRKPGKKPKHMKIDWDLHDFFG